MYASFHKTTVDIQTGWHLLLDAFFDGYTKALAMNGTLHLMTSGKPTIFLTLDTTQFCPTLLTAMGRPLLTQNVYLAHERYTITMSLTKLYDQRSWSLEKLGKENGQPHSAHDIMGLKHLLPW